VVDPSERDLGRSHDAFADWQPLERHSRAEEDDEN
jgi:hypothetical protein